MDDSLSVVKTSMTISEAKDNLAEALSKIEKNRILQLSSTYEYLNDSWRSALKCFTPTLSISAIIASCGIFVNNPELLVCGLVTSFMGLPFISLMEWDGNPEDKVKTFVAKYIITSKAKRLELKSRQDEFKAHNEEMKIFQLYVANLRSQLEEMGVMEIINNHDETRHSYISDNGELLHQKKIVDIKPINSARVENMIKELSESPGIRKMFEIKP